MDKTYKCIFHNNTLLKFLVLLLPHKYSDLILWTLWPVHIAPQQSHTSLSEGTVRNANHLVSYFELFIHVFGHFWHQHCGPVFLSTKVFCWNGQVSSQSHEMVGIYLSPCKIVDQAKVSVLIFLEHLKFHIQVFWVIFGPKAQSNLSWHFTKCTESLQVSLSKETVVF